ncbi:MAG: four helix bundle protein [Ginsengibacter sp.]
MKNFKELIIWKRGIELVKSIYILSRSLPAEEKFGMISQLTKAAVSIPANIAEGSSRNSERDYARFLQIALGSAFEVQTYLVIVKEMNWATNEKLAPIELFLEEEIKMMHSFSRKLGGDSRQL